MFDPYIHPRVQGTVEISAHTSQRSTVPNINMQNLYCRDIYFSVTHVSLSRIRNI